MHNTQKGFTLIELMIVVAIIGILAAIAIPAYQDYTQRAQVGEAFTVVSSTKTAISEFRQTNGVYPDDAAITALGLEVTGAAAPAGQYVDTIEVGNGDGIITVTLRDAGAVGSEVADGVLTFSPPSDDDLADGRPFVWTCTAVFSEANDVGQKYLPRTCTAGT
jgi:type IV pilus assembly protein PilA